MGAFFSLMAIGMFTIFSNKAWLIETIVAQQWFDALGASLYIVWYVSSLALSYHTKPSY